MVSTNRLLDALSRLARDDLALKLDPVALSQGQILHQAGAKTIHAYFPTSGLLSVTAGFGSAESEIGLVGREGMTGLPILNEAGSSAHKVFVQIAGAGYRIPAGDLRRIAESGRELKAILLRYSQAWSTQIAQTSLANARSTVRERLARWLAMSQDRVGVDELAITHETLAAALSVRRPGVTVATHELEGVGAIRATRGRILIRDRQKLEESAGVSYGDAEREYERLLAISVVPDDSRRPAMDGEGLFGGRGALHGPPVWAAST